MSAGLIVRSAGPLPHIPDAGGVLFLVCVAVGDSKFRLGQVLHVEVAANLRRRAGAILAGTAAPGAQVRALQDAGGEVDVLHAERAGKGALLEVALVQELAHRSGDLPAWTKAMPKKRPDAASLREAEALLDALNIRPR